MLVLLSILGMGTLRLREVEQLTPSPAESNGAESVLWPDFLAARSSQHPGWPTERTGAVWIPLSKAPQAWHRVSLRGRGPGQGRPPQAALIIAQPQTPVCRGGGADPRRGCRRRRRTRGETQLPPGRPRTPSPHAHTQGACPRP